MQIFAVILFAAALALADCRSVDHLQRSLVDEEAERLQNENAYYRFDTKIQDGISDLNQERQEVREGRKVQGLYSYSDGFVKKTVHYEADENGYRVVGEEEVPLDGPRVNLHGTASISQAKDGQVLQYSVQSVPVENGTRVV